MTTTSLIHHKPPPLKTRNDNPAVYLRTNNYYGSVGRPNHGRRKSAVELLQETKAFYVKSESVLDTKQEFKNAEHLHVHEHLTPRSPTNEMNTNSLGHNFRERGGPHPSANLSSFPYATFSYTCPNYPHEHCEPLQVFHSNYLNSIKRERHHHHHHKSSSSKNSVSVNNGTQIHTIKGPQVTAKITLIDGTKAGENWEYERKSSSNKRSQQILPITGRKELISTSSGSGSASAKSGGGSRHNRINGTTVSAGGATVGSGTMTFTSFSQNGSLYSSLEKHAMVTANLPVIPSKNASSGKVRERKNPSESDSPPPLPPKSPRTAHVRPNRPSDFPQRLVQIPASMGMDPNKMLPPPPPRKHRTKSGERSKEIIQQPILRRSHHSQPESIVQPMTLPSPILPPTPPPHPFDVVMESPMSDSGPIISPPPAFSTPVTPMLDRQNSSVSDRSTKNVGASNVTITTTTATSVPTPLPLTKTPLSAAVSMSGVSSISSRSHSHNDDVSMPYSPRSRSRLSSSPMSHQDAEANNSGPEKPNSRRASGAGSSSVFSSGNEVMSHKSQANSSVSPSEEEDESEEAISADLDGDDDDSSRAADDHYSQSHHNLLTINSKLCRKDSRKSTVSADGVKRSPSRGRSSRSSSGKKKNVTISLNGGGKLSKSITENFLCTKVSQEQACVTNHYMECSQTQTLPIQHPPRIVSPVRRPILRSKSDLSHRYIKTSRSATLAPGFTLDLKDLGPPVPLHNSTSTSEFPSNANKISGNKSSAYQIPAPIIYQSVSTSGGNHYHKLHPVPHPHAYHTLQPSSSNSHSHQHYNTSHYHHPSHLTVAAGQGSHVHAYARSATQPSATAASSAYENLLINGKSELDRFFDQLGLENKAPLDQPSTSTSLLQQVSKRKDGIDGSDSPVFFSSISSIDSCARKSGSGDSEDSPIPQLATVINHGGKNFLGTRTGHSPPFNSGGNNNNNTPSIVVHHGEPSIVERNARVIKWLFNCRKAMENR